jgi:hypothetical protein
MTGTRTPRVARWRTRPSVGLAAVAVAALATAALAGLAFGPGASAGAGASPAVGDGSPGSQGVVSGLPATTSQLTVNGSGSNAGMAVTVNQTQSLTHQAVSVSWTGAPPTNCGATGSASCQFQGDYLQIMQCWSDPQTEQGPDPTQCEYGGESSTPTSAYPIDNTGFEYSRVLSEESWSDYSALQVPPTWVDTTDNYDIEPFDAVNGTVVNQQADYGWDQNPYGPKQFWLNPYYSFNTTNEIDFARTYANGAGQQLFDVDTGLEAPGLGCGQDIEPGAGNVDIVPKCWIVVVPRGTPGQENPPNSNIGDDSGVVTSPLSPTAWANRIQIPIQFNPLGSSCTLGGNAQQILGNELAEPAAASWLPALCGQPGAPLFGYIQDSDEAARTNLTSPAYGAAGMSVFSNPIDASQIDSTNPVVYAPLTLSGVVVGFNIERYPGTDPSTGNPYAGEVPLAGDQVANIYLTPRLVAKLLTESYQAQLEDVTNDSSSAYAWIQHNPVSILTDPDFLQYNPEFAELTTTELIDAGTVIVEEASSDANREVWQWILSDPAALAWLQGQPDPWGMRVNPLYTKTLELAGKSAGVAPDNFPKSDSYCHQTGEQVVGPPPQDARPLCVLDWSPYSLTQAAAAENAAEANDGAKTTFNLAQSPQNAWGSNGPQPSGTHFIFCITDTVSAARFGLQTADLSAAGDDGPDPTFVAPNTSDLLAGEKAMAPSAISGVLEPDPSSTAAGAYPLTMLTYAATRPETLSASQRALYAQFLSYATGTGQTQGFNPGQLPAGYVPLPSGLVAEDATARATILNPPSFPAAAAPTATPAPVATTTAPPLPLTQYSSAPASAPTTTSPAAARARSPARRPLKAGVELTTAVSAGWLRWLLPFLLLLGLTAGLAALLLRMIGRPKVAAGAGSGDPPAEPPAAGPGGES